MNIPENSTNGITNVIAKAIPTFAYLNTELASIPKELPQLLIKI